MSVGTAREGVVKSWHEQRGFGFVADMYGLLYFVHASDCPGRTLEPGQRVRFRVINGIPGKSDRAVDVQLLRD